MRERKKIMEEGLRKLTRGNSVQERGNDCGCGEGEGVEGGVCGRRRRRRNEKTKEGHEEESVEDHDQGEQEVKRKEEGDEKEEITCGYFCQGLLSRYGSEETLKRRRGQATIGSTSETSALA